MSNWTNSDIEVLLEDLRYELWENMKHSVEFVINRERDSEAMVPKEALEEIMNTAFANIKEKLWEQ